MEAVLCWMLESPLAGIGRSRPTGAGSKDAATESHCGDPESPTHKSPPTPGGSGSRGTKQAAGSEGGDVQPRSNGCFVPTASGVSTGSRQATRAGHGVCVRRIIDRTAGRQINFPENSPKLGLAGTELPRPGASLDLSRGGRSHLCHFADRDRTTPALPPPRFISAKSWPAPPFPDRLRPGRSRRRPPH